VQYRFAKNNAKPMLQTWLRFRYHWKRPMSHCMTGLWMKKNNIRYKISWSGTSLVFQQPQVDRRRGRLQWSLCSREHLQLIWQGPTTQRGWNQRITTKKGLPSPKKKLYQSPLSFFRIRKGDSRKLGVWHDLKLARKALTFSEPIWTNWPACSKPAPLLGEKVASQIAQMLV